jgi:hypothetical protein
MLLKEAKAQDSRSPFFQTMLEKVENAGINWSNRLKRRELSSTKMSEETKVQDKLVIILKFKHPLTY